MSNEFIIFLISGGKDDNNRKPLATFIESDYTAAKLYFYAYVKTGSLNDWYYKLHKIARLEKGKQVIPDTAYITDSISVIYEEEKPKVELTQLQFKMAKEHFAAERAFKYTFAKTNNYTEAVRAMFNGKYINDAK